jgi:hypothetical protein
MSYSCTTLPDSCIDDSVITNTLREKSSQWPISFQRDTKYELKLDTVLTPELFRKLLDGSRYLIAVELVPANVGSILKSTNKDGKWGKLLESFRSSKEFRFDILRIAKETTENNEDLVKKLDAPAVVAIFEFRKPLPTEELVREYCKGMAPEKICNLFTLGSLYERYMTETYEKSVAKFHDILSLLCLEFSRDVSKTGANIVVPLFTKMSGFLDLFRDHHNQYFGYAHLSNEPINCLGTELLGMNKDVQYTFVGKNDTLCLVQLENPLQLLPFSTDKKYLMDSSTRIKYEKLN